MCIAPVKVADGVLISCKKCWACEEVRVQDFTGRCMAENVTATKSYALTLTYGGGYNNPDAYTLQYRDIQLMLKRLRISGYQARYICAGEYGSEGGRAHFHLMLFFDGKFPTPEMEQRIEWEFWPHGFAYFEDPQATWVRYMIKYTLKNAKKGGFPLRMSKKPPLGAEYFKTVAQRHVKAGTCPKDWKYGVDGQTRFCSDTEKEIPWEFYLSGASRERFLDQYYERWSIQRSGQKIPCSDLVAKDLIGRVRLAREKEPYPDKTVPIPAEHVQTLGGGLVEVRCGFRIYHEMYNEGEIVWRKRATEKETQEVSIHLEL